jgi:hypothetical protein
MRSLRMHLGRAGLVTSLMLAVLWAPGAAIAAGPPTPTDTLGGSDWDVAGNWSAGHVPGPADVALVETQATVHAGEAVGALELGGNARLLPGGGSISVGSGGFWEFIQNGSELNVVDVPVTVAGPASFAGDLNVDDVMTLSGPSSVDGFVVAGGSSFPSAKLVNTGTLDLGGNLSGSIVNTGTLRIDAVAFGSGNSCLCGSPTINTGTIDVLRDPKISNQAADGLHGQLINQSNGQIDVAGGALLSDHGFVGSAPDVVLNGGELTGTGVIEAQVHNVSGTVSPGGDGNVGTLTIEDPNGYGYVQGSGGTLRVDVRGSQPAAVDELAVGGPLKLDGNLYIDSSGYTPTAGVDYQVTNSYSDFQQGLTAAPSGTFAHLIGPGAPLYKTVYYPATAPASVILRAAGNGPSLAPTLSAVSQLNPVWRLGNLLTFFTRKTYPVGTTFSLTLDKPATVTLTFYRHVAGRKVGGRCIKPTHKNRHKHSCKRLVAAGMITFNGHGGANSVHFQGRLSKSKHLKLGHYTLVIVAAASGTSSKPATLSFTIAP